MDDDEHDELEAKLRAIWDRRSGGDGWDRGGDGAAGGGWDELDGSSDSDDSGGWSSDDYSSGDDY